MKDLPWFPLYATDFTNSRRVRTMSPKHVGIYALLLCHEWDGGPLPADPEILASLANGADPGDIEAVLKQCFVMRADGWVNERLERERLEAETLRERRVRAGRLGGKRSGKVRSHKKIEAPLEQTSSNAEAMLNDCSSNTVTVQDSTVEEKKASLSKRKPRKPETEIPPDWLPSEPHVAKASTSGLDLTRETQRFRQHHAAKGSLYRDWSQAFHTWLDNAVEFGHAKRNGSAPHWSETLKLG